MAMQQLSTMSIDEFWFACKDGEVDNMKAFLECGCIRDPSLDVMKYERPVGLWMERIHQMSGGSSFTGGLLAAISSRDQAAVKFLLKYHAVKKLLREKKDFFIKVTKATDDPALLKLIQRGARSRLRAFFSPRVPSTTTLATPRPETSSAIPSSTGRSPIAVTSEPSGSRNGADMFDAMLDAMGRIFSQEVDPKRDSLPGKILLCRGKTVGASPIEITLSPAGSPRNSPP